MTDDVTMPGDRLAAAEEYMAGPGTYERDGEVYAAVMGKAVFSEAEKTVRVQDLRPVRALRPGDEVVGTVVQVTNAMANVRVSGRHGEPGETGAVHVSRVTTGYTDDARKELHQGDLVRARVTQTAPSLQLSTAEPELGVLSALCSKCRKRLMNKAGKLYCPECERQEHRKLASDFARYTAEAPEEV